MQVVEMLKQTTFDGIVRLVGSTHDVEPEVAKRWQKNGIAIMLEEVVEELTTPCKDEHCEVQKKEWTRPTITEVEAICEDGECEIPEEETRHKKKRR